MRNRSFVHGMTGAVILLLLGALLFAFASCGTEPGSEFADPDTSADSSSEDYFPHFPDIDAKYCKNLQCKQIQCEAGLKTSVSGVVYDPAGKVPLYNVLVYVPNAPVKTFSSGATCDKCGSVSGEPIVTALTNTKGEFILDNVPVGQNIPLVIQIGKWRRQVTIPGVTACGETRLTDKDMTRLPRNQGEGDIPQMALTTGGADALECLLRKIGLDDAEFTNDTGKGRVHMYQGQGGGTLDGGISPSQPFWSSLSSLKKYDILLLSCEGAEFGNTKPNAALQALLDYTTVGGRVFASHFHYYWFERGIAPFPSVATWNHGAYPPSPLIFNIDMSFPKGAALAEWLVNTGGSTTLGQLSITEGRNDVTAVNAATSQRWIYGGWSGVPESDQYLTFNTPVNVDAGDQCGRVVYSDLHVGSGDQPGRQFPAGCVTVDLTAQQKALEFMLFDLSSCVQSDDTVPVPPVIK